MDGNGAIATEAERQVIGALLLVDERDTAAVADVFSLLSPSDFADELCRAAFAAIERLHKRGAPIETTMIVSEMDGAIEDPTVQLLELGLSVATAVHVVHHAQLVAEASRQRRLVCMTNDALLAARRANHPAAVDDVIDDLGEKIVELKRGGGCRADVVRAADVQPEQVDWLWPGRVAIGKVTLLAGDPGLGKSLLTIDMAARVSRGAPWPDAPHVSQPAGGVVLLSAEDDLADTVRPRLDAHGADVARVFALRSLADLARDLDQLRAAIDRAEGCRLVVVDPVSAFMGRADSHVNAEVRAVLAPLAELAAEKRIAIVCVTHLRKGEGAAMYRAMGSLAFVAAARAAWAVVRDKHDPRRRLLLAVKNNLASDGATTGLAYAIEGHGLSGAPVVCWEPDAVTISADEALAPEPKKIGRPAEDRNDAEAWLRTALADGPRPAKDVVAEATVAHCIAERTLERAKRAVGVVAFRRENPGPWWWQLPGEADRQDRQPGTPSETFWHSGGVPNFPTVFADSEAQTATPPQFQSVGSEPSTNGYADNHRRGG